MFDVIEEDTELGGHITKTRIYSVERFLSREKMLSIGQKIGL